MPASLNLTAKRSANSGVLDKKLIIEVREHSSGGAGEVYILDDDLKVKDRISVDGEVWSLDCRNGKTAVLTQNGVNVYDGAKLLARQKSSGSRRSPVDRQRRDHRCGRRQHMGNREMKNG